MSGKYIYTLYILHIAIVYIKKIDMSSYMAENKSEADEQKSASSFNDFGADMDQYNTTT